jgi:hypothetical protein
MKYLVILLSFPSLLATQCDEQKGKIPSCIQQKIDSIKAVDKWNPPAEVNEYIYQDKHVYLFSADCCDQFNQLFDSNCNYICAPSGGITGKGDMKCPDFSASAKFVKLVWKDPR